MLELSRRSGVARNTIAALERGEGNPTVDTLYALADALGVPLVATLLEAPTGRARTWCGRGRARTSRAPRSTRTCSSGSSGPGCSASCTRSASTPARRATRRRTRSASRSGCTSSPAACASARRTRRSSSGPGDYARYSGSVPHVYEALGGEAAGTLLILTGRSR